MCNFVSNHKLSETRRVFLNQLSSVSIPNNVQEAMYDLGWKKAMEDELDSLQKNGTWEMVDRPVGKKPVGCKWIFTVKHNADGSVERLKARLVAKGYTQTYGTDYTETFAPVAKINSVRVIMSLAASLDWNLQHLDVKNAFLHGNLQEEVYMEAPEGYMQSNEGQKVCRLRKSLYGLKQSPRAWFGRLSKVMIGFGYKQSNHDHTLFIKRRGGKLTILIVYVDDMLVTGNDEKEKTALIHSLAKVFELKNLGEMKYFLGIEVSRSKKGICLSQRKYTLDLLTETGMSTCKPASTPVEPGLKLRIEENQVPTNKDRYRKLVGKLMYLAHTRPDLAYALSMISQFMHNPGEQHMNALMRILRYLKAEPGKGLLFEKHGNPETIEVFTDADWAGSIEDRRSTSGYFTFVGGNLVTWRSKKQSVVARSSAEAELRGMVLGLCEGLWIKYLMQDLGYSEQTKIKLFCDNKAAREIAHNPIQHDRMKHVEIDRFFLKEKLDSDALELPVIRTDQQVADILTKPVTFPVFKKLSDKLQMYNLHSPLEEEC